MFWLNCHHQKANTYITKTCSNKTDLQRLRVPNVQITVKT
jgi:hypothetical protein